MMAYHRRFRKTLMAFLVGSVLVIGPVVSYTAVGSIPISAGVTAMMLVAMWLGLRSQRAGTLPIEETWGMGPDAICERIGMKVHKEVEPLAGGLLMVPKYPWVAPIWMEAHAVGATVVTGQVVAGIWRKHTGAPLVGSKPSK